MNLPDELILNIYDFCDFSTRININRAFNWNYKAINPYKNYNFISYKKSYAYDVFRFNPRLNPEFFDE